ncbi:RluA family pseudouridine synthase [Sneathiella sp. CAU 1612]|uniref:Pseudouridine synthase n=1 Tax=Sneathiella sedimenti TaxID=2816034 RepID=A0ABS3F871_9PROT|nr:RluA family pseudouridine synthase [Sneathiella sedimenti]MBO0334301.1 RluA family pseudouridine synthase [Sneathiella sedimenti]
MSRVQHLIVTEDEADQRLDRWFKAHFPGLTHGQLEKHLRKGDIRVDKKRSKANDRLEAGQTVRVPPLPDDIYKPVQAGGARPPESEKLSDRDVADIRQMILHMDDSVIVLNKPAGLPVQGGSGQKRHIDGLLEGLRFDYPEKPRLVHRLDKDTSGVLVLGRTRQAAKHLAEAFKRRTTRKIYWALLAGVPKPREGTISYNLAKIVTSNGEKVVVDREGQKAITDYSVVELAAQKAAWVTFKPLTGRTHQLRVHAVALGTPIVGDGKYGGPEAFLDGIVSKKMHLHAREITISHPDGDDLTVSAPLDRHMAESWKLFGFHENDYEDPFLDMGL